ncbi:MAG TPA: P-II family nitrogen regulator [Myxococcota bacterium]|nr:P-II family nitrogen regulator [Myxococcota bacterium]
MKKIEVWIAPSRLDDAKDAMLGGGASGLTATEVLAPAGREIYRAAVMETGLRSYTRVETVVHDDLVSRIVGGLERVLARGPAAGGLLLVAPVFEAVRIRTGEIDEAAIA